jgi:glucose-6-phosphate 1-dehydrogenase
MNPYSTVETFMDITLVSDDPAWHGVPIRLVTGKSLDDRFTEIIVTYKKDGDYQASQLRITLQPQMSVSLDLWIKAPGYEDRHEQQPLTMSYNDHYNFIPQAYERVFFDAINLNRDLFLSSAEVLESWRIVQPVQQAWAAKSDDLSFYLPGSRYDSIGQ